MEFINILEEKIENMDQYDIAAGGIETGQATISELKEKIKIIINICKKIIQVKETQKEAYVPPDEWYIIGMIRLEDGNIEMEYAKEELKYAKEI